MKYRALEEIAGRLERKRVPLSALMPWRVRTILLVSSKYDSFTFQEDGSLTEMLFSEYLELNLNYAPAVSRASMAREAIEQVRAETPDLVITMPRVGDMDVFAFGGAVKEIAPNLPVILLAYDTRELAVLMERGNLSDVDRIFVWQGDVRLFLAIIKLIEDRRNAWHDAETAGVKSILLIEDSIRFYSAYVPMLYTELVEQTQALMAEGVNRMQKLMRMRARPKIMLANSYEEGEEIFRIYREHILGVIADARFPRGGAVDSNAGPDFVRMVKAADANMPVLLQSSERANHAVADSLGAAFIDKTSPRLLAHVRNFLRTSLGFGDFVFRHPDGSEIARAKNLRGLMAKLASVPDDSLLHHAGRNDFSTWLMARTEFDLAKRLRPMRAEEFDSPGILRRYLLGAFSALRNRSRAGLVAEFSSESFDPECCFTRIGPGSLGGKGRGLAFIDSLMNSYLIENHIPGVRIFIPPSAVVATGVFDRFMEESNLTGLALGQSSDEELRQAFLNASLPEDAAQALRSFLARVTYPLAVRSSSLLEDSSHQPFAGVYETHMLPNNDPDPERRLEQLCQAIRLVYASTYYSESKSYIESTPNRLEEEKMAVVIQQVAGRRHGDRLYPDFAGVARSFDYYPMEGMDSEDGVASVALGLGRTVVDGGRCVRFSPAHPQRLFQFSSTRDYLKNSQREFYALDLARRDSADGDGQDTGRQRQMHPVDNLLKLGIDAALEDGTLEAVGSVYSPENDTVYDGIHRPGIKLITMAGVLDGRYFPLPEALHFLLEVGKAGFSCDVEIEFAVNLNPRGDGRHELAFLQVRPLVFGSSSDQLAVEDLDPRKSICISPCALGHGHLTNIHDLVYVRMDTFDRSKTPEIAGEIGAINGRLKNSGSPYLLIGPGRWGSADRWLGIPVTWAQISGARCIVETDLDDMKVTPSQGSHFFQNITSFGIGYFTINTPDEVAHLDRAWLDACPAQDESEYIRHLKFPDALKIVVDSRRNLGVVLKPDTR